MAFFTQETSVNQDPSQLVFDHASATTVDHVVVTAIYFINGNTMLQRADLSFLKLPFKS